MEMTCISQGSEPDGDAGDQYTGLDRFNRIEDIRWLKRSGGTSTDVERIQYGFDRAGNRMWRKNLVAPAGFDEAYEYDGLYQLGDMRRGSLWPTFTKQHTSEGWKPSRPREAALTNRKQVKSIPSQPGRRFRISNVLLHPAIPSECLRGLSCIPLEGS